MSEDIAFTLGKAQTGSKLPDNSRPLMIRDNGVKFLSVGRACHLAELREGMHSLSTGQVIQGSREQPGTTVSEQRSLHPSDSKAVCSVLESLLMLETGP